MKPLLEIQQLKKYFFIKKQPLKAVDDVSFEIYPQETLGLVGESGCGKTTLGRTLIRLYEPTAGNITYEGKSILTYTKKEIKHLRRKIQYIFQDPFSALNPRMTVKEIITEPLKIHCLYTSSEEHTRAVNLMTLVGLHPDRLSHFPHEFSGGQRQRIGIARALALNPAFIVCDEPIAALDASIQAQIINELKDLQKKLDLTYLFISHDLAMVKYLSDRVAVMYLGKLMELAPSATLYTKPLHPYTQALLSAIPIPDPEAETKRTKVFLPKEIPSPLHPPPGCPFSSRCPQAMPICKVKHPAWKAVSPGHFVSCHLYES